MPKDSSEGSTIENTTDHHDSQHSKINLKPAQSKAIAALATGSSIVDAALDAGVDRTTVHRWLREDYDFQAAWNRVNRELETETRSRIDRIAHSALDSLEQAVSGGDPRIALAVLKGAGLLDGTRTAPGSEDPTELEEQVRIEAAELVNDRELRALVTQVFRSNG